MNVTRRSGDAIGCGCGECDAWRIADGLAEDALAGDANAQRHLAAAIEHWLEVRGS